MARVAGVDGCRGGWFALEHEPGTDTCRAVLADTFQELLGQLPDCELMAVDIPIGLADSGPRECDLLARKYLNPGRGASVFPAPIRPALSAQTHAEASDIRASVEGKRMSVQAFLILPKIREVDIALRATPPPTARVVEVHPEVSFAAMADGRPMQHKKLRSAGRDERIGHLERHFPAPVLSTALAAYRPKVIAKDDICDALAALWSAQRVLQGIAGRLPPEPVADRFGMDMAIWY